MGTVQRPPLGLLDVLGIKGVDALPTEVLRDVRPALDMLQFYGLQQRRVVLASNAALASGGNIDIRSSLANVPATEQWAVLFGASAGVLKVAATTDVAINLNMTRGGLTNTITLRTGSSSQLGNYGAAGLGSASVVFWAPYPILMPPPWNLSCNLVNLAGVANAQASVIAEIGCFG